MKLELYNQEKWNRWPKEFMIAIALGILYGATYYADKYFNIYVNNPYYDIPLKITGWLFGLSFFYMFFYDLIFKERNLKEYVGLIELKNEELLLLQNTILLKDIELVKIQFKKAEGEFGIRILPRGQPYRSNGTDNQINVRLKSGKQYNYFVRIKHKKIFRDNNKILTHYYNLGLIEWNNLLELFEIYDSEIEEKLRIAIADEKTTNQV